MKSLRLPLKRKWFEMTKQGIKTEDYREITPYWVARLSLCEIDPKVAADELLQGADFFKEDWNANHQLPKHCWVKEFERTVVTLGYPKSGDDSRTLTLEHKGIEIREGNPEWGAEPGKLYFVILHGKVLPNRSDTKISGRCCDLIYADMRISCS